MKDLRSRIVDGKRKTEGSVEEYILDVFKNRLELVEEKESDD